MLVVCGVLAAVAAAGAMLWTKHPVRWILALLAVAWTVLVLMFDFESLELDPNLPTEFADWLRPWTLFLGLAGLGLGYRVGSALIGTKGSEEPAEDAPGTVELESALREVDDRLSQARFDAGTQNVFLLMSRDEALAADFVRASGMSLFAAAPASSEAPVHAYASSDGLFVSCAGASSWGLADGPGAARLERLVGWIRALSPEKPPLRGIVLLVPMEDATSAEALKEVGPLRNDLQSILSGLALRCPVILVFCVRDGRSGFAEFASRMPAALRDSRCGFSTPASRPFDASVADRGLRWFLRWLQSWSLSLMVEEQPNREGNSRLVELTASMRRDLPALRTFAETVFTTHARAEPIMVRGCYAVLCGPGPEDRAFVGGLARGPKCKLAADARLTTWGREAGRFEQSYRRAALALAAASAALAAPVWIWAIAPRLRASSPGLSSGLGWLAWAIPAALAAVWAAFVLVPVLRGRGASPPDR